MKVEFIERVCLTLYNPLICLVSVEEGVDHIEKTSDFSNTDTDVLITGSLHLIGSALQVLHPTFLEDGERGVLESGSLSGTQPGTQLVQGG